MYVPNIEDKINISWIYCLTSEFWAFNMKVSFFLSGNAKVCQRSSGWAWCEVVSSCCCPQEPVPVLVLILCASPGAWVHVLLGQCCFLVISPFLLCHQQSGWIVLFPVRKVIAELTGGSPSPHTVTNDLCRCWAEPLQSQRMVRGFCKLKNIWFSRGRGSSCAWLPTGSKHSLGFPWWCWLLLRHEVQL